MIIKGLFRRYERWNPVHPTMGAFWGMGIGIGCGVGWGPGFGPEVIGYVGAGCGVGFSVGFTVAGVGVGLPANSLFKAAYHDGVPMLRDAAADGWGSIAYHTSHLRKEALGGLASLKGNFSLNQPVYLIETRKTMLGCYQAVVSRVDVFKRNHLRAGKGTDDD